VISFSSNNPDDTTEKIAVIKGLQKGYYKVRQENSWSWKYDNIEVSDTYTDSFFGNQTGSGTDGILFLGDRIEDSGTEYFFGEEGNTTPYGSGVTYTGRRTIVFQTLMSDTGSSIFE
jgi:hypothetical protein